MSFSFVILMKKLVPNFVPMFLWYPEVSHFFSYILSIDGHPSSVSFAERVLLYTIVLGPDG